MDFFPQDFGAHADGVTKDTAAIQAAIDAAGNAACDSISGGARASSAYLRVVLDGGIFLSGVIQLRSGVELHIAEGARLLASPDIADFPDWPSPRHVIPANLPRGRADAPFRDFAFEDCDFRQVPDSELPGWKRHGAAIIGRTHPARIENAIGFKGNWGWRFTPRGAI